MSVHIEISGLPEHTFTKLAGAIESGGSLQITIEDKYIQLNEEQVKTLVRALGAHWGIDYTRKIDN